MKINLLLLFLSLLFVFAGLAATVGAEAKAGAVLVLAGCLVLAVIPLKEAVRQVKATGTLNFDFLLLLLGFFVVLVTSIHAFGVAIDKSLVTLPGWQLLLLLVGFLIVLLFAAGSVQTLMTSSHRGYRWLVSGLVATSSVITLYGLCSVFRILEGDVKFVYYGWVFMVFAMPLPYLLLVSGEKERTREVFACLTIAVSLIAYWAWRWQFPGTLSDRFFAFLVFYGIPVVVFLPVAILLLRQYRLLLVFVLYTIVLDLYFLSTNREVIQLVKLGTNGCVNFEAAVTYPVNFDPGISLDGLFRAPSQPELDAVSLEWSQKDFSPGRVRVEKEVFAEDGTLQVISHQVNGLKHYGFVYLQSGLDVNTAPVLMLLPGKSAQYDVFRTDFLRQEMKSILGCNDVYRQYIVAMPSFRGNAVRGEDFCFRSSGYSMDAWLGAAEDGLFFLESVKALYRLKGNVKVLALGASRGATVGLIMGALSRKIDYIISISTHTNFLDKEAYGQQPLHDSYPAVFFTPSAPAPDIRRRMIASSPYFFLERMPPFEIHQGTQDPLTTVMHARLVHNRINAAQERASTQKVYFYEGKGHGFFDAKIVCDRLETFLSQQYE
ncbi:MAG: hypothetical protein AVDCRST_MAG56-3174 [uncultured Cytophagales bacterium]|uniref:Peptidase S9 prolyl oligopeptidase catalytic domain-containing protein n=1 Tax=uncultured Cytophagales bacterium TaxID=158755 RepID=A0A6J4J7J2_9SPHI|nr:MAG: hypothetical protein AVDCRST_MAG56-3174 [uncultured Cytophagales bacterium]